MDMQRRPGCDGGLKDAQGSAGGMPRRFQARIAGYASAGRNDIASQEVGHGYMIALRLARVLRFTPDRGAGGHATGVS
jgi:hypothetical protein